MANELRTLGIDPPAGLDEESDDGEEPELGLVSQQSFPTNSLSLLRDPNIFIGDTGAKDTNADRQQYRSRSGQQ